ncbi:hypothetical protein OH775_01020 [Streptomyces sp. NBC_01615]
MLAITRRMIFPERVLGMSGTTHNAGGPGDLADLALDGGGHLAFDLRAGRLAGFEGDVHLHRAAAQLVHDRYGGGLGDLLDGQRRGFEFLGAEAVSGDVDDVVDAAQDAEVAVRCLHRAVAAQDVDGTRNRAAGVGGAATGRATISFSACTGRRARRRGSGRRAAHPAASKEVSTARDIRVGASGRSGEDTEVGERRR